jgi:hypothetical protein
VLCQQDVNRFKWRHTCDAPNVLFQISFVQQRPVPCTGLHCTPPRKAREIEDPKVPCPLHLALCSVLCLCVLFCVSVSLCSVRSVGPLNRTSLHSPTQGAGGRETLVFQFLSYMSAMCSCSFSSINSSQSMSGTPACSRSKSSCSGCNTVHRVQDGTARRGLQSSLHQVFS